MSGPETLVLGGGLLGAAVARAASASGGRVVVASRTPRAQAGLWRRLDVAAPDKGLVPVGGRVVVALAPGPGEPLTLWSEGLPRLVAWAHREGAATVVVCGPAGRGAPDVDAFSEGAAAIAGHAAVLRFGPLFGQDDPCVWPVLKAIRESGAAAIPRGLPRLAPLFVDDAARAALRLPSGDHVLRGPAELDATEIGDAIVRRFGGRWRRAWWTSRSTRRRLDAQAALPDRWDEDRLGARLSLAAWIERLPGLRRRR